MDPYLEFRLGTRTHQSDAVKRKKKEKISFNIWLNLYNLCLLSLVETSTDKKSERRQTDEAGVYLEIKTKQKELNKAHY